VQVQVVEGPFQPIILEPGFEDNTLPDGSGDGRDSWRTSIGGVIQITGSPVTFGSQGAKLPDDQSRVGYQEIVVEAESNYDLTFWYTMLANSSDPFITVAIVGVTENGPITTREEAEAATIASVTVNDTEDPLVYVEQKLSFASGANDKVGIYFFNGPVEARLDNFTIEIGAAGAVPPSAGFDVAQSEENFLEYTFTNTSKNGASYLWDFGDGNTSTEESPTHVYATPDTYTVTLEVTSENGLTGTLEKGVDIQAPVTVDCTWEVDLGDGFQFTGESASHTYREDGIYTVTLTSTSITGLQDSKDFMVTISQGFIATISEEASFEDNDPSAAACGSALDGRDCWRNSALGGVIQITSGPTVTGSQAAKLPSDGSRIGYQRIAVTVAILDGSTLTDISQVAGATLASTTVNNQDDANAYVTETVTFNSGGRSEVAIFFSNEGVETRIDDFSIEAAEPAMVAEGGFEDNSLADGTGDGRDSWRNSALGGVIQITSGPVVSGSQAAKLPSGGDRIGYQKVAVLANTNYTLTYNYTMKTSPEGSLTVSILDGRDLTDISEVAAATIATSMVNDQTDANAYITETINFNTGSNTEIAICLGGVIQITSSPTNSGSQAAKFPSGGDRVGMQELQVEPNTNYRVSFFYTMKTDPTGSLTAAILDGSGSSLTDLSQVAGATITSVTVNDQTDANAYIMEALEFNSGANSTISILFTNEGVECRVDDVSITTL